MAYMSGFCVDDERRVITSPIERSLTGKIYAHVAFFQARTITLPNVMVRREILEQVGGFDEAMDRFEDTDVLRRISKLTLIAGNR